MSHLKYFAYPGVGETNRSEVGMSQAVRVGERIECSGQGGWNTQTGDISENLDEEIDQAFANVDYTLRDAGGKGWVQVFKIRLYIVDDGAGTAQGATLEAVIRNMKKWMPDHQPICTYIVVPALALKNMHIEVEVEAHDPTVQK